MIMLLIGAAIWALLFGAASAALTSHWGGDVVIGFIFGLFTGPFGFVLAYWLRDPAAKEQSAIDAGQAKRCPDCAEPVRAQARICRYCGHDFATLTLDGFNAR